MKIFNEVGPHRLFRVHYFNGHLTYESSGQHKAPGLWVRFLIKILMMGSFEWVPDEEKKK